MVQKKPAGARSTPRLPCTDLSTFNHMSHTARSFNFVCAWGSDDVSSLPLLRFRNVLDRSMFALWKNGPAMSSHCSACILSLEEGESQKFNSRTSNLLQLVSPTPPPISPKCQNPPKALGTGHSVHHHPLLSVRSRPLPRSRRRPSCDSQSGS